MTDEKVETQTVTPKPKKNKTGLYIGIAVGGCFVFIFCIGFIALSVFAAIELSGQSYNAENPHEELELYIDDLVDTFADSIDFSDFDKDNPEDTIDVKEIENDLADVGDKLQFWRSSDNDISNTTLETALDFSVDLDLQGDDVKVDFRSNILVAYKDFDYENFDLQSTNADVAEFFPDIQITGSFDFESGNEDYQGDFDMIVTSEKLYLMLDNLQVPQELLGDSDFILELLEGEYLEVEISEYLQTIFSDTSGLEDTSTNINILEDIFNNVSAEDEAFLQESGNDFFEAIGQSFDDLSLFKEVTTTNPVREVEDTSCYKAEINYDGIFDSLVAIVDKTNAVIDDSSVSSDFFSSTDLDEFRELQDETDMPEVIISACVDSDDYIRGIGIDYEGEEISFDFLVLDYDSKKEIIEPSDALNLDEFELEYLEDLGFDLSVFDTGLLNLNLFDLDGLTNLPIPNDPFMTDYDSDFNFDTSENDSFDFDFDYDYDYYQNYSDELDQILNDYIEGSLSDEEYLNALEDLNQRYQFE